MSWTDLVPRLSEVNGMAETNNQSAAQTAASLHQMGQSYGKVGQSIADTVRANKDNMAEMQTAYQSTKDFLQGLADASPELKAQLVEATGSDDPVSLITPPTNPKAKDRYISALNNWTTQVAHIVTQGDNSGYLSGAVQSLAAKHSPVLPGLAQFVDKGNAAIDVNQQAKQLQSRFTNAGGSDTQITDANGNAMPGTGSAPPPVASQAPQAAPIGGRWSGTGQAATMTAGGSSLPDLSPQPVSPAVAVAQQAAATITPTAPDAKSSVSAPGRWGGVSQQSESADEIANRVLSDPNTLQNMNEAMAIGIPQTAINEMIHDMSAGKATKADFDKMISTYAKAFVDKQTSLQKLKEYNDGKTLAQKKLNFDIVGKLADTNKVTGLDDAGNPTAGVTIEQLNKGQATIGDAIPKPQKSSSAYGAIPLTPEQIDGYAVLKARGELPEDKLMQRAFVPYIPAISQRAAYYEAHPEILAAKPATSDIQLSINQEHAVKGALASLGATTTVLPNLVKFRNVALSMDTGRTDLPMLNKALQSLGYHLGDQKSIDFATYKAILSAELPKALTGGGQSGEAERIEFAKAINAAVSPKDLAHVINNVLIPAEKSRINAILTTTGKRGQNLLESMRKSNPEFDAVLNGEEVDPVPASPPNAGVTFSGVKYVIH